MTCSDDLDFERLINDTSVLFRRRMIELQPDEMLDDPATPWDDAIVFVTTGAIELECSRGERHCFRSGDILSFARLPIRGVRNRGTTPARLLVIWRRTPAWSSPVSFCERGRHTDDDT